MACKGILQIGGGTLKSPRMVCEYMPDNLTLGGVRSVLEDLDYPLTRVDAAQALEPYRLVHSDGEDNLGALISEAGSDSYESPEDVEADLHNQLPPESVGEIGESEGEG